MEGDFHSLGPRSRNLVAQNFRVLLSPEAKFCADERGSVKFLPLFGGRSLDKALFSQAGGTSWVKTGLNKWGSG